MTTDADDIAMRTSLMQRLGRTAGSGLRSGPGFWRWWGRALASWLPPRLQALLNLDGRRLLLYPGPGVLRLELERGGQAQTLVQLPWPADAAGDAGALETLLPQPLATLPRWLVLPADAALRRPLLLPAAAGGRLREVLAFEIDRQTPFAAGDVRFDAHQAERTGDGRLKVELVVVPRARVDAALAPLGTLASGLAGVDLDGGGEALGVNLLPEEARHRRADPWRSWHMALAAFALLALVSAMWMVLDNRRQAADAFEQASLQRIAQAREAAAQRRELDAHIEGMGYLAQLRAERPAMIELLDELSRRLPDSTWLETVTVENDRLLLIGQSTEASALVQRLGDSPLWRAPALTGALQPDPRTRRDRFSLTAELVRTPDAPAGGDDAQAAP